jgi:hypothetical protein
LVPGGVSVTFREKNAQEIIYLAAKAGLKAVEWGADVHARPDDGAGIDAICLAARENGILNCSYGSYYRAGGTNEFAFSAVLDAACRLKAPTIRIWAGTADSAETEKEDLERLLVDLRNICAAAKERDTSVAMEFHHGTYADNAASALRLIKECPGLRAYWQENPQISFAANLRELRMLLPHIVNVHIFNFDKNLNRYPLAEMRPRLAEYISILKGAERKINVLLEFVKDNDVHNFAADAEVLIALSGGHGGAAAETSLEFEKDVMNAG